MTFLKFAFSSYLSWLGSRWVPHKVTITMTGKIQLAIVCFLLLGGCAGPARSTRLQLSDLNETASQMAVSLAGSQWLGSRTARSPLAVVTCQKVLNLTTDLIPPAEQWMIISRLRSAMPLQALRRTRNLVFQLPPERQVWLREHGFPSKTKPSLQATHVLSATFRSARRDARRRTDGQVSKTADYYFLEFEVHEVASRQIVWSDRFELKRQALGLRID